MMVLMLSMMKMMMIMMIADQDFVSPVVTCDPPSTSGATFDLDLQQPEERQLSSTSVQYTCTSGATYKTTCTGNGGTPSDRSAPGGYNQQGQYQPTPNCTGTSTISYSCYTFLMMHLSRLLEIKPIHICSKMNTKHD